MAKTIAFVNQKGGVGKTTSCVSLGSCLQAAGARVLVCDFDPQGNATSGLGINKREIKRSVYDVIIGEAAADTAIIRTKYKNLDILPSSIDLAAAEIELVDMENRALRLKQALTKVQGQYDYICIDCPPSLDLLTVNGLCASDTVLIPLQCEYFALEGLTELMNTLKIVRKKYNRYLDIEGVLFTMYSGRLNLTMQVVAQVKKYYGDKVYKAVIPRSVRLSEAPSFGMPINFYEPNGKGSEAYMELAREFLNYNEH